MCESASWSCKPQAYFYKPLFFLLYSFFFLKFYIILVLFMREILGKQFLHL